MPGKFELQKFADIDLNDTFFDELKRDYPGTATSTGFVSWFQKKSEEGRTALVFYDEEGLGAFVCIKAETESIALKNGILPKKQRTKISTLRIAERYRGQRLGEGAIGLVLWKWQALGHEEIYVTVFPDHDDLIGQLERFGFIRMGENADGERIYLRSRTKVDYSDPYKAFPFVNPDFKNAGYLLVNDFYHDTLFPYSELKNTLQTAVAINAANGLTKIYVGAQYTTPPYKIGEPILIYRIHTGNGQKKYKSCLTSFCIVTNVIAVKRSGRTLITFDELIQKIGNKSVFDVNELRSKYNNQTHMFVVEMLYAGYFGEGNNVNMDWLETHGYWSKSFGEIYPALIRLSADQFKSILKEGNIDVDNVIID